MTVMSELRIFSEQGDDKTSLLQTASDWRVPAVGEPLTRDTILRRFDTITAINGIVDGVVSSELATAHERSVAFVEEAFDIFEGKAEAPSVEWAFAVPSRGEELQGEHYASEVTFFLPLLDPRFGVNAMVRQRSVAHLAPAVIERYKGDEEGRSGALVWTPVYFDPLIRRDKRRAIESVAAAQYRVNEAAEFTRHRLNASVMGLGAVLPGLTKFGKTIDVEGLHTTTGHGGTVHLVAETLRKVAETKEGAVSVGAIGLGSIGLPMFKTLYDHEELTDIKQFTVHDINHLVAAEAAKVGTSRRPVHFAQSQIPVLERSDIIIAAATIPTDLDALESEAGRVIDLTGKVIIDDSQPGSFDRAQVEARGGALVWVVGEDGSEQHAFERQGGYAYGDVAGLYGSRSVWGCEAEAGSLALLERPELAIRSGVTPDIVRKVGAVCVEAGIRVPATLQSYGRPVEFF